MLKKLICVILSVIMCGAIFSGCSLVSHNDEKDAQQVVVTISPITDGAFVSETKYIYKSDLNRAFNEQGMSEVQQGADLGATIDKLVDNLVVQQLLIIETERLKFLGELEWGQKQINEKLENIYSSIDSQLLTIQNEILTNMDESEIDHTIPTEPETTYPVKPAEVDEEHPYARFYEKDAAGQFVYEKDENGKVKVDKDGNPIHKIIVWKPTEDMYPAMAGSDEQMSLERQAVENFIVLIKDIVSKDFKVTAADKEKFKKDDADIKAARENGGIQAVYAMLGFTHYMEYIIGKPIEQSLLLTQLEKHITKDVTVGDEEVINAYDTSKRDQENMTADEFDALAKEGKAPLIVNKTSNYFYVKHILLPFSKEDADEIAALRVDVKNGTKPLSQLIELRDTQLVAQTVVYPHVKGEDDKSSPLTVKQAFDDIYSAMNRVSGSAKESERMFDDLIYKYNTDPGIFEKTKGYAVKTKLADGEKGEYMEEFEKGARELYNDYQVGQVLPQYVVTDFGVHVMYYSGKIVKNTTNAINSYETPGEYKTYFDIFKEPIQTNKESKAFEYWQDTRLTYYQNTKEVVERHTDRYEDLKGLK